MVKSFFNKNKRRKSSYPQGKRKKRERNHFVSYFFLLIFAAIFSIVVIMESNSDRKYGKLSLKTAGSSETSEEEDNKDYSNDIWYEDTNIIGNVPPVNVNKLDKKMKDDITSRKIKKQKNIPIQADWQPVQAPDKFFVYSAYYISKLSNIVRVIGATKTKTKVQVQCRLYDNFTRHYSTVDGTIRTIRENWNLKYSACFILCHIPPGQNSVLPRYISILADSSPTASATNILRVYYPESLEPVNFSVCVKPLHFNYNNYFQFIEWIEFHKLLGVEKFTFYNHTIGNYVSCLMEKVYENEIRVLPWNLPFLSQKEIRTEGLFASLNDCAYRHRGSSKYLIMVDLDEIIIPRRSPNYTELLSQLETLSSKKRIGAYSLQNAFYYLQWPDTKIVHNFSESNTLIEKVSTHLLTLRKTRRRARLHPHKQRSKYICIPDKVIEAGNHFIWEMTKGYTTLPVPHHIAALNHYRVCEFGGDQCTKNPSVIDNSTSRYAHTLVYKVAEKLEEFSKKCEFNISKFLST